MARAPRQVWEGPRGCELVDVINIVDRLFRKRVLHRAHLRSLVRFGRLHRAPERDQRKEFHSACLWEEAMAALEKVFREKEIIGTSSHALTIGKQNLRSGRHG